MIFLFAAIGAAPGRRIAAAAAVAAAVFSALPAVACNVPVFRFALECWPADAYLATVFYQGSRPAVEALEKAAKVGRANLRVEKADLAGEIPVSARRLWESQANTQLPWLVVQYPDLKGIVWSGPFREETAGLLLASPARSELSRRLLHDDSAVWVLLESGDTAEDDRTAAILQEALTDLEQRLELPLAAPEDPRINPDIPLKIVFSVLRVSRTAAAEQAFVAMLLGSEDDLKPRKEPMVFPVYGRGRFLPAMIGAGINRDNIDEAARFMTGACSCEAKAQNPGVDLLVGTDWDGGLEGKRKVELPPASMPTVATVAESMHEQPSGATVSSEAAPPADDVQEGLRGAADGDSSQGLWRHLTILAGAAAVLVLIALVALRRTGRTTSDR